LAKLYGQHHHPGNKSIDLLWELVEYNNGRAILHRVSGYLKERHLHRHRWVNALCKTEVPIQLIQGEDDIISGAETIERFKQLVPAGDVCTIPHVGHFPQIESPESVVAKIESFIRKTIPLRGV